MGWWSGWDLRDSLGTGSPKRRAVSPAAAWIDNSCDCEQQLRQGQSRMEGYGKRLEKRACTIFFFFFRNGSGRATGKAYNTCPGTLALEENCLCRSSVVSLMGFRFKAKGINLTGSSAQESYSQKEIWNIIHFHWKCNFFPNSHGLFHWPYQTETQNILRAGAEGGFTLSVPHLILQRLGKGHHSI